jgi:lipoprotein-anchoring transpeptidase ErfK/SrfK
MALRQLSVLYLAAASSFAVAALLAAHPALNSAVHTGARFTATEGEVAAVALNDYVLQPGWALTKTGSSALYREAYNAINPPVQVARAPVKTKPVAIAKAKPTPTPDVFAQAETEAHQNAVARMQNPSVATAQSAPPVLRPPIVETPPQQNTQVATINPPAPKYTLAPQAMTPNAPTPPPIASTAAPTALPPDRAPSAAQLAAVSAHLRDSLTQEMLANFELFLFVSKAQGNAVGQRMYVFQKQSSGDLVMLYNWPVSTGRELDEIAADGTKQPTITPAGYYELDSHRMYVSHFSGQWHQPMPYAMFFNWQTHGYQTGLAIHGASGKDIALLGERASAGCIHLSPENARVLFSLIKNNYKGLMPKFAYDKRTATMSNNGVLVHTADGHVEMTDGYKVLVFIENYGGENVVAALF